MRYNHFTMLPDQAFKPVGKKMTLEGGGGSPPAQPTQTSQVTIPEYARPYMERLLGKAEAASETGYQTYGGQRAAGPTTEQQAARQDVAGMGPAGQYDAASGLAGMAGAAALSGMGTGYQPMAAQQMYQAPQFQGMDVGYLSTQAPQLQQYQMGPAERVQGAQTGAAMTDYAPNLRTFQMGPAERARTGSFAMPGAAEAYMSPYMQNVVDVQQREAQRQADIARTQRGAQAVGAGAFGGSRQAIMESEAARNLSQQKGDIQAQGLQSAYQQAQQAYQTDAARQLQAQLANQQAMLEAARANQQTGLQAQLANQAAIQQARQQNLAAALGVQELGAQQSLAAQQMNQGAGLTAGQANLQSALATQQLGRQSGLSAAQANQQTRLAQNQALLDAAARADQLAQQATQSNVANRLAALGQQTQSSLAANQIGQSRADLQRLAQAMELQNLQALQQGGSNIDARTQQVLDLGYQDFINQRNFPYQQLNFLTGLLANMPQSVNQEQVLFQRTNPLSQISGLATAGLGALQAGLQR